MTIMRATGVDGLGAASSVRMVISVTVCTVRWPHAPIDAALARTIASVTAVAIDSSPRGPHVVTSAVSEGAVYLLPPEILARGGTSGLQGCRVVDAHYFAVNDGAIHGGDCGGSLFHGLVVDKGVALGLARLIVDDELSTGDVPMLREELLKTSFKSLRAKPEDADDVTGTRFLASAPASIASLHRPAAFRVPGPFFVHVFDIILDVLWVAIFSALGSLRLDTLLLVLLHHGHHPLLSHFVSLTGVVNEII
jgi:hypothetical protein